MQYLYDSGDSVVFMDNQDYDQIEIPSAVLGDTMQWVLPNSEVEVLFVDEQPSDVTVPSAVEMKVTQTDPGLKGDTASGGGNKPATLESGAIVQVPLFIEEGEPVGSTPAPGNTSPARSWTRWVRGPWAGAREGRSRGCRPG